MARSGEGDLEVGDCGRRPKGQVRERSMKRAAVDKLRSSLLARISGLGIEPPFSAWKRSVDLRQRESFLSERRPSATASARTREPQIDAITCRAETTNGSKPPQPCVASRGCSRAVRWT